MSVEMDFTTENPNEEKRIAKMRLKEIMFYQIIRHISLKSKVPYMGRYIGYIISIGDNNIKPTADELVNLTYSNIHKFFTTKYEIALYVKKGYITSSKAKRLLDTNMKNLKKTLEEPDRCSIRKMSSEREEQLINAFFKGYERINRIYGHYYCTKI